MSAVKISSLSLEFLSVPVAAEKTGAPYDPTGDAVDWAFKDFSTDAEPSGGDWVVGNWETDPGPPAIYYARCLVGPGGTTTLTDGKYHVWLRITDSPEIIVRRIGVITVE